MNLNIREMIDGPPSRLRYVFRYSTSRVEHPESVAEHSYFVAFYCLLIARWFNENNETDEDEVSTESLLQRAILHDLEEAISGDVPRSFKHSSPDVKEMLDKAAQKAFVQVIEPVCGKQNERAEGEEVSDEDDAYGPSVTDEYICSWLDSKDGTVEGRILEFADYLAVLGFMMQEGAHDGNKVIKRHVAEMHRYFARFEGREFDFIRPLVQQAGELTREIL